MVNLKHDSSTNPSSLKDVIVSCLGSRTIHMWTVQHQNDDKPCEARYRSKLYDGALWLMIALSIN